MVTSSLSYPLSRDAIASKKQGDPLALAISAFSDNSLMDRMYREIPKLIGSPKRLS